MKIRKIKRKNRKKKRRLDAKKVGFVIFIGFIIAKVFLAIHGSSLGATLVHLENKEKALAEENRRLSGELIEASSLSVAMEKAEEMGFSKTGNIVYLSADDPVARLP